jgi:hypothetical protein
MGHSLPGLGVVFVWLVGSAQLLAASFSLAPAEIMEATRMGGQSIASPEFGKEWQVVNPGGESLTVLSPFYRVALAARHAAFKREVVKPKEVDTILKQYRGRLVFRVELRGKRVDFARWYEPVLATSRSQEIQPVFVQNERTAVRLSDAEYIARCLYAFPVEGVSPNARVTLSIRDRQGREVTRFVVDLSTIR